MFYTLAILSMLGYTLQTVLLVPYVRKHDTLCVNAYRCLSLGITMLPLLAFTEPGHIGQIIDFWPELLGACLFAISGSWINSESFRHLAVGVTMAASHGFRIAFMVLLGYVAFGESLSGTKMTFMALILAGNTILSLQRAPAERPYTDRRALGFTQSISGALMSALAFTLVSKISRELDPLIAAYFWESGIGIIGLGLVLLRRVFKPSAKVWLGKTTTLGVALASSPTVIGTGCFALAVSLGPMAIIGTIGVTGLAIVTLYAHFRFNEKISSVQWLSIGLILIATSGLRLLG